MSIPQDLLRRAYAHDASHYLLYPSDVRIAQGADDVRQAMIDASRWGSHLTFRGGGTSLNGQASTDGILIDVRRNFQGYRVDEGGAKIRVEPGLTVRMANAVLRRHGYKIGPDPASEIAATIGGVLANNASGMSCGVKHNTYHLLDSLTFLTARGTLIDTAEEGADQRFASAEPELYAALEEARDLVRADPDLVTELRRQFAMKNTMGYSLEALLDFDKPVDIFAHLLVGSEGTLAFVSEIVLNNVEIKEHYATALVVFPTLVDATVALPGIIATNPAAVELMDSRSLKVGQSFDDAPQAVTSLDVEDHAAFLLEYQATSEEGLVEQVSRGTQALAEMGVDAEFSSDPNVRAALWSLRKGLYTSVAGARTPGATALLEDIAVPPDHLAAMCLALDDLFKKFGYDQAVIFGHAKDGNIHFMITDHFDSPEAVARLEGFTTGMVAAVLAQGGTLKAEHGTGRAMAPYVLDQFGPTLYKVMLAIKAAADPEGILNPGVIFEENPGDHVRHLKPFPTVDPLVAKCVECGYCEPSCPSRDLTLTPRQRIVLEREIAMVQAEADSATTQAKKAAKQAKKMLRQYVYPSIDTCAVDGMCELACPVDINTADLVRSTRKHMARQPWTGVWGVAAKHWQVVTQGAGIALGVAKKLPWPLLYGTTAALRVVLGKGNMPLYTKDLPSGGKPRKTIAAAMTEVGEGTATMPWSNTVVYMPSCLNTMFAPATGETSVQEDFMYLCAQAGIQLRLPRDVDSTCCGTPWSSKGMAAGYETNKRRTVELLTEATNGGELPVVCDASSCTEGLHKMLADIGFTVIDAPTFLVDRVLPVLADRAELRYSGSVVIHPTCASTRIGSASAVRKVAEFVSDEVTVPDGWGCCAFAGDRGMLFPELTASATAREAAEVAAIGADLHVSSNRTCEIGMTRATGNDYGSVVSLLARAVRLEG